MTSPRNSRYSWIIAGLSLVLAGMIAYYILLLQKANRQLLITAVPAYEIYDANPYAVERLVNSYRGEFEDTLNYQNALRLQKASEEMNHAMRKLYATYVEQSLNDLFAHTITPVEYYSTRISIPVDEQQILKTRIENYYKAFQVLCERPVILYWETPYRMLRTGLADTVVVHIEPVIRNLEAVNQFIPVNGTITIHGARYALDDLSPDDLTYINDYWCEIHRKLVTSYNNVLTEAGYVISRKYKPLAVH